ncbi:type II secretion system F family protein [bacterium]|nr:type II secretion system F family protein [bacterium]
MIFELFSANPIPTIIVFSIAIFGIGLFIFGIFTLVTRGNRVTNRMDQFVVSDFQPGKSDNGQSRRIISREISGSLFNRTIKRWFRRILGVLGRFAPKNMTEEIDHQLTIAGNPGNLHASEFYALRIIFFVIGIVLAIILARNLSGMGMTGILLALIVMIVGLMLPNVWLRGQVRNRQNEIQRGLPDALDMLSVCASAGLGFDQSLQKISDYWETDLGEEFRLAIHEMEMGISRSEALRHMSDRLDVDDLTRFIALMIQAEKVGMSYADVLHSQAIQMRVQRQYRAREIANKLPGKMIMPIALLIFPAMLAVILGPSVPLLLNIFE